jgi:hypothetical protein
VERIVKKDKKNLIYEIEIILRSLKYITLLNIKNNFNRKIKFNDYRLEKYFF